MRDERLVNAAIDATARSLTEAAPSRELRSIVSRRIERGGRWSVVCGRWSPVGSRWPVVGGVTAVALVLAAVVLWPEPEDARVVADVPVPIDRVASEAMAQVTPALETPAGRASSGSPGEPEGFAPRAVTRATAPAAVIDGARPANESIAPEPIEVPAVAAIEPIELELIEPFDAVELPMIVVDMIDIDPMAFQQ